MSHKTDELSPENGPSMPRRRQLLIAGAGVAAATLMSQASAGENKPGGLLRSANNIAPGKRKLGSLEVSSVGLGVQNMSRKYDTSVPWHG